ncbi:2-aminoethylphosphonate transporter, membrane component [Klebsiella pneumoniae]|nr:2-aminoethylphosphonate transporter, membrane component [Klebsiella pneumoniae]
MLIWSRKGRAAAGALAVTLFAGVFLLPLAVILLSSLSKQWNGLLPTGFTFAHFVNAFRGAAWDSLFSSLMVGFCASMARRYRNILAWRFICPAPSPRFPSGWAFWWRSARGRCR